jgi:hypothetical protein
MLDANLIQTLPQLSPPVLTAYLDTNRANRRNQGHPPGFFIWLKSRAKVIGGRLPSGEQKLFRKQLERVEDHLRNRPPQERGLVIFAGPVASPGRSEHRPDTWEVIPLQVEVEDELHWGRPSLTQLLWLLDEHQPCGVVLVDRSKARFFRFWLGEAVEQSQAQFQLDISRWLQKDLMPPSHPGIQKTRGSQRDVFEQRIEAQYARLYREAAERIRQWSEREKLNLVFLAGPSEVIEPVWGELPRTFREHAALVKGVPGHITAAELHARLEPEVARWKRSRELTLVDQILATPNGTRAVVGMEESLTRLQQGDGRELVVARQLRALVTQLAQVPERR